MPKLRMLAGKMPALPGSALGGGDRLAARRPAAGEIVVLDEDAEVGDLVAQGVAMDAEGLGGAAEVPPVRLERGDDELLFELPSRLLQGQAATHELVDDLVQAPVEVLVGQVVFPRKESE